MPGNPLPRWRGFNLLEKFHCNPRRPWTRQRPFRLRDFLWTAEWGFDFIRLPMSWRCWSSPEDPAAADELVLSQIDDAVEHGRSYGIHVCLNMHRAPGYCINPPAEPDDLWSDAGAQDAFILQWRRFAARYRGISSERLSFDLVNEPPAVGQGSFTEAAYVQLAHRALAEIRAIDPQRLVIADGHGGGNDPTPGLDPGIAQSCRGYLPMGLSHHRAGWVRMPDAGEPAWPGGDHFGTRWDRGHLARHYRRWTALIDRGTGVHCGEWGCYNRTSHPVALAWMEDVLAILREARIGWALWNLRGDFGVLDSGRADVAYDDWQGHRLDTAMLRLLQRS